LVGWVDQHSAGPGPGVLPFAELCF